MRFVLGGAGEVEEGQRVNKVPETIQEGFWVLYRRESALAIESRVRTEIEVTYIVPFVYNELLQRFSCLCPRRQHELHFIRWDSGELELDELRCSLSDG